MPPKRILLVEDDAMFASISKRRLEQDGYLVSVASDGEAGKADAQKLHPDAIVLDIGLPKLDGFAVLEALKADAATASIPVIMYSRLSAKEDVEQCKRLGATAYLMKSHHGPDDLATCLQTVLAV